ncbi:CDP-diacylglycerol diphosphatase [Ancylobacter polymorphus]|uniref:CDP-diacylglycerol pyrophosphatase n=1 Tax=Ancylobacter polymorphus TaxID=223390 RepID=A0ABU0BK68_9HYPH|nr:CDP-diacylglycerol diphosphatase [Ancylobacter polymorphus]MDQ0305422.1 hypothetical protein [Ancylobacter polymorphus]
MSIGRTGGREAAPSLAGERLRGLLPVLGLVLALAAGTGAVAEPRVQACPLNPSATTGQVLQWASPPAANRDDKAPLPCAPCTDPANRATKTCAVFRLLTSEACAGGRCADAEGEFVRRRHGGDEFFLQYDTRHRDPARYPRARGENCRFVLWAIAPVIGIEDVAGYAGRNYWQDAYVASQTMVEPPFARNDLAFAIQPPTVRGQHQFHIHIGTLAPAYRTALAGLARNATRVRINSLDFHARFIAVPAGSDPFAGLDVSGLVRAMLPGGAADLPLYGVMAVVTDDGRGLWILAAEGFERAELNFIGPMACRLR